MPDRLDLAVSTWARRSLASFIAASIPPLIREPGGLCMVPDLPQVTSDRSVAPAGVGHHYRAAHRVLEREGPDQPQEAGPAGGGEGLNFSVGLVTRSVCQPTQKVY